VTTPLGPVPPHLQLFDFLPESEHRLLLEWVLNNSDAFVRATVTSGKPGDEGKVNEKQRIALTASEFGEVGSAVEPRLQDALDQIIERIGYSGPKPSSLELELAAHGHGAHYLPHLDIAVGEDRLPLGAWEGEDRALSAVYYFHREPKGFSGGELRLYRFGSMWNCDESDADSYVDLQPHNNSLVVFQSWAMHEVRRVSCPSGDFKDYRFALNCWYCRPAL
jgi:SM-20-related protein